MAYFLDDFTGTPGTNLEAHTSDSGHTWTIVTGLSSSEETIGPSGEIYPPSGTSTAQYRTNFTPGPTDPIIWRFHYISDVDGTIGIYFNASTTLDSGYNVRWSSNGSGTAGFDWYTFTGGSPSNGQHLSGLSNLTVGHVYEVLITPNGSGTYTCTYRDLTAGGAALALFTATDTTYPSGVVGIRDAGPMTPTTGYHTRAIWTGKTSSIALAGPTSLVAGAQSGAYTVTLNAPNNVPITINLASSVSGDTFQGGVGGTNITQIVIADGTLTGTFYLTPSLTSGNRSITLAPSPAFPVTNSPLVANVPTVVVNATAYTFTGPVGGVVNATSTPFTITPNGTYTGTITIGLSGGGLTLPTTLTWSGTSDAKAFAISPTATGTVTLTPSNSAGLTDPVGLSYHVAAAASIWMYRSSVAGFASGLSTVSYAVVAHDNSFPNGAAWVRAGVAELTDPTGAKTGIYAADVGLPLSGNYHVLWTDGGTPPRYATDDRVPIGVEPSGFNQSQALSLILAATSNLVSGFVAGRPSNPIFLDPSGSTPRITGVSDTLGNRSRADLTPPV